MSIDYSGAVFAKRLASVRSDLGLSQDELASKVGVSKDTIMNWERGSNTPRLDTACRLADVLQCAIDDLVKPFPATRSGLVSLPDIVLAN